MNWVLFALGAAVFASFVAIFGKLGLSKDIDTTLATTVRAVIMAVFLLAVSIVFGKFHNFTLSTFTGKEWMYIALAGIAGAISWLLFFYALKHGDATAVSAIDRTSIIFVIVFAALFLGESLGWKALLGAVLVAGGTFLITMK